MDKNLFDFNKEVIFGEFGGWISAPITAWLVSLLTQNSVIISTLAVFGSIIGASICWVLMRVRDEKVRQIYSIKHLIRDVEYFTPAAFVLAVIIYYPAFYLMSHHILTTEHIGVIYSTMIAQAMAFSLFLVAINVYHHYLYKITGENL